MGGDFRDYIAVENKDQVIDRYARRQKGEILPYRYEVNTQSKDDQSMTVR